MIRGFLGTTACGSDPYGERFLARVHAKVARILLEEQRGVKSLEIRCMHKAADGRLYRRVTLQLNPGPPLLQKLSFIWDEPL